MTGFAGFLVNRYSNSCAGGEQSAGSAPGSRPESWEELTVAFPNGMGTDINPVHHSSGERRRFFRMNMVFVPMATRGRKRMLRITNVSKQYQGGRVKAVNDLSLTVRPGEIFGFLGPNGAGKTTTIKMIVGLLMQDCGDIKVAGYDTAGNAIEAKSKMGYVPDNPELYDRLTGLEFLDFIADVYQVTSAERHERFGRYLEMFELGNAAGSRIESYSHGMKQKLALTAALIHAPELLVLDEPMVGLDPRSSHLFKAVMREQCASGRAVFFSTHILEVAENLCDRVGIIHHGRLIACGTLDEIRRDTGAVHDSLERLFLELTGA